MKQNANLTGIGQLLRDTQQPYISAPLISAPNSTIRHISGITRQIPDPSKTLKPALGIERVMCRSVSLKQDEVSSNGERVFEIDSKDSRIRFVGNIDNPNDNTGGYVRIGTDSADTSSFCEVTFYGTGLNVLTLMPGATPTAVASVDGGSEGSNFLPNQSTVLGSRGYSGNIVVNVVSGLSLGVHTVRIRKNGSISVHLHGFEILNNSSTTNIVSPKGSVIANGNKFNLTNNASLAFATGFDGNPALNGRGGKVVVYLKDGQLRKVIQQAGTQLNLSAADHTNEELIRKINFREFGANRADDFSTLSTARAAMFTLDDGITTLSTDSSTAQSINGIDSFFSTGTSNFFIITFVGTGLDLFQTQSSVARDLAISVDGISTGTIAAASLGDRRTIKVVSGLPYGTHNVKVIQQAGGTGPTFSDFLVYGPKTPSIPDGAIKVAEYNLMGNYAATVSPGADDERIISSGTLRKASNREFTFVGTWAISNSALYSGGISVDSSTNGSYFEATFFGTGLEVVARGSAAITSSTIQIDGVAYTGAAIATGPSATWTPGTSTWVASTREGTRLQITGLTLGFHKIRVTKADANQLRVMGIESITPVHISANKVGSMSIADIDLINKIAQKPNLDLSKAKAWVTYDGINQRILSSNNISAVLRSAIGDYYIYFEKPFINGRYAVVGMVNENAATSAYFLQTRFPNNASYCLAKIHTYLGAGADMPISVVFFGELEDEE